jgi:hypothetical protein
MNRIKQNALQIATIVRTYYEYKSSKINAYLFKYLSITGHGYYVKSVYAYSYMTHFK